MCLAPRPHRSLAALGMTLLVFLLACNRTPHPAPRPPARTDATPKPLETPAPPPAQTAPVARDLDAIRGDRTLRVLFTFNSTGYFIYRGETMGYEYELLRTFALESGLNIESVVVRDSKSLFDKLNRGEGDLVAAQLVETPNESEVLQTAALYDTKP